MADQADETATPWTIKNFPIDLRKRVVKAAEAADMTIPEWLTPVLLQALDQQAQNGIIPPRARPEVKIPAIDLAGLAAATNAAIDAIKAAGGTPPANLGSNVSTTVNFYARAARGLAASPSRQKPVTIKGQSVPRIGVDKREAADG